MQYANIQSKESEVNLVINDGREDSVAIIKEKADELLEAMNASNGVKSQEILQEIREHLDNLEGIIAVLV